MRMGWGYVPCLFYQDAAGGNPVRADCYDQRVVYEEFAPAAGLADRIASYWRFEVEASDPERFEHTVVPDGTVNVVWARGMAVLVGPRITAMRVPVERGPAYAGIRFVPGVAGPILGIEIATVREKSMPLALLKPERAAEFSQAMKQAGRREQLAPELERVAAQWVSHAEAPDPVVQEMTRRILASQGMAQVADLSDGLGLSYRQLLRRFYKATGLSPKELSRLRRVRWACVQALGTKETWPGIAAQGGFADQSHMGREFSEVFGWPPALVKEYLERIEHRNVLG